MKYAWIVRNKAHWPITLACEVLGVSARGYFEHGRRKKAPKPSKPDAHKRRSDEALLTHIRAIHAEVKGEYGWPKMWKELVARYSIQIVAANTVGMSSRARWRVTK